MSRFAYPPLIGSERSDIATIGECLACKHPSFCPRYWMWSPEINYGRVYLAELETERLEPIAREMERKPNDRYRSVTK